MLFVFFKQKTAYEMRISDWSSDVCSSDLPATGGAGAGNRVVAEPAVRLPRAWGAGVDRQRAAVGTLAGRLPAAAPVAVARIAHPARRAGAIGRRRRALRAPRRGSGEHP